MLEKTKALDGNELSEKTKHYLTKDEVKALMTRRDKIVAYFQKLERTVHSDNSTRWVSQEHGSKQVNDIDASQVEDGDRVIVKGTWDKDELHATLISKRLSHSK